MTLFSLPRNTRDDINNFNFLLEHINVLIGKKNTKWYVMIS